MTWLLTKPREAFVTAIHQAVKASGFAARNPHLTQQEKDDLLLDPPVFPLEKPVWSAYKPSKPGSFYSQVRPSGGPKIHLHRLALVYKIRFLEHRDPGQLAEDLKVMEASHLMGNYIGHQRDFNPHNLALEYGPVNKSRDSCQLRTAMRQARHVQGSSFNRETFLREFCLGFEPVEEGGSQPAAGAIREINSQNVLSPVGERDTCCREIHDPPCRAWKPVWGEIPATIGTLGI